MNSNKRNGELSIFVHLAYGYGGRNWNERYRKGKIRGINEPFAYGYHRAAADGCRVTYSEDRAEGGLARLVRLGLRYLLKFDFVHAWRNRAGICAADVVWTHTESQHAAILLLWRLLRPSPRPRLIAQSVWLFDRWHRFPRLNRWLFAKLLEQADLLTVLSPENLRMARTLFPAIRSELVLYGIRAEERRPPRSRPFHAPIRLLSLGNDEHRDWATLIAAVKELEDCELRIASDQVAPRLLAGARNVTLVRPGGNAELLQLYDWADAVILALKPNLHASGITVLQEAVLLAVPAMCSDIPGLRAYFSADEITYMPPGDATAIRCAIRDLAADAEGRDARVRRAQARMGPDGLSSQSYVERHVALSRDLVGRPAAEAGGGRLVALPDPHTLAR